MSSGVAWTLPSSATRAQESYLTSWEFMFLYEKDALLLCYQSTSALLETFFLGSLLKVLHK